MVTEEIKMNQVKRFFISVLLWFTVAGVFVLYTINVGCESKKEGKDVPQTAADTHTDVISQNGEDVPQTAADTHTGDVISQTGEDCVGPSSKCPSLCLNNDDYYICDEFEGEEGIETDVWKVTVNGDGMSYLVDDGYLTISGNDKDKGDVKFSSVQSQPLSYEKPLIHSIETKAKLEGGAILYLSDGLNGCVVFNADNCAVCGEQSVYESDACTDPVEDIDGWHKYFMTTNTDGNGKPIVTLFQDTNKITEVPATVTYGEHALSTNLGCLTYDAGSCQFDYVRGMKSDVFF